MKTSFLSLKSVVFGALRVVSSVALASCAAHTQSHTSFAVASPGEVPEVAAQPRDGRVVLVTLDGARWQDVFDGLVMPRTHELITKGGVGYGDESPDGAPCGSVRTASGMNMSLPGYLEIFTGRPTRCSDNGCARVAEPTLLDVVASATSGSAASIGSWEVLDHAVSNGSSRALVAAGRRAWPRLLVPGGRLESLVTESLAAEPFPGVAAYRPDAFTSAIALEYLRVATPVFLHVGLGDMDEWAHRGDYPAYVGALRDADDFIGALASALGAMGDAGAKTTVIITADHGRNFGFRHHGPRHPEAGRVFMLAFGARVGAQGFTCAPRDITLADVSPTVRALLGIAPAPPSLDGGAAIDAIATRR